MKVYIREWRLHLDVSQTEIASRMGISKGAISRYESGSRRISTRLLAQLGQAFGVDPKRLLESPVPGGTAKPPQEEGRVVIWKKAVLDSTDAYVLGLITGLRLAMKGKENGHGC